MLWSGVSVCSLSVAVLCLSVAWRRRGGGEVLMFIVLVFVVLVFSVYSVDGEENGRGHDGLLGIRRNETPKQKALLHDTILQHSV